MDFEALLKDIQTEYDKRTKEYYNWNTIQRKINGKDIEFTKDVLEVLELKRETDFEDILLNQLSDILDFIVDIGLPIISLLTTGVPIPTGDLNVDIGDIGLGNITDQVIGKENLDKLKKVAATYSKGAAKQWNRLSWTRKMLAMGLLTKYMWGDLNDGHFKQLSENPNDPKYKAYGVKNWIKRINNRVLFYKLILTNWSEQRTDIPSLVFKWEMSPRDFAYQYILYRLRIPNHEKIDNYTALEKLQKVYELHKYFKDQEAELNQKLNPVQNIINGTKSNKAAIGLGLGALFLGLKK